MPDSADSKSYAVEPYLSTLEFLGRSTVHAVEGKATNLSGRVEASFGSDGTLVTDPAPTMTLTFPAERLTSGNRLQDQKMLEILDSRRFPIVSAELRSLRPDGAPGNYAAEGDVTMHGKTKRYMGNLTLVQNGNKVVADGELQLDIRDFGLEPPKMLFMKVEPQMKIRLHLVASEKA